MKKAQPTAPAPTLRDYWCIWFARRFPARLLYWCFFRVLVEAKMDDSNEAAEIVRRWPHIRRLIALRAAGR